MNPPPNKSAPRPEVPRCKRTRPAEEAVRNFFARRQATTNLRLGSLWEHWATVMGDYLAPLAMPLGEKDGVLRIGAEDNMLLQDLSFMSREILERVNAFMEKPHFTRVQFELLAGRHPLHHWQRDVLRPPAPLDRPRPADLGSAASLLDQNSPVGRSYAAYIRSFED